MIYKIAQRPVHIMTKRYRAIGGFNIPSLSAAIDVQYTYDGKEFIDSTAKKANSHVEMDLFGGYEKYLISNLKS